MFGTLSIFLNSACVCYTEFKIESFILHFWNENKMSGRSKLTAFFDPSALPKTTAQTSK